MNFLLALKIMTEMLGMASSRERKRSYHALALWSEYLGCRELKN